MIPKNKNVNAELVKHLQGRLSEVEHKDRVGSDDNMSGGLQKLLGFFEEKLSNPQFASDYIDLNRKKRLYLIFEQAVQKSLVFTKRSENYDDFPELTVLYFLRDADESGFTVKEIESVIKELKHEQSE